MKSLSALRFFFFFLFFFSVETILAWTSNKSSVEHANPKQFGNTEQSQSSPSTPDPTMTRRKIFTTIGTALISGEYLSGINPRVSLAAEPGEVIRRSAAYLPGYGPSDVFYPESFAGNWKMTREVEFNNPSSSSSSVLRLTYPVRFIRSIEDDSVVADRGFNQAELESALVRTIQKGRQEDGDERSSITSPKVSYEWAENNPNDLRLVLSDGTKKEIKVTKRATERTIDTVSSSEFQRVTQEDVRRGGIPSISARRIVSKYKRADESTLEGIEIVYEMAGGDPLSTPITGSKNTTPMALSKSKLYLVR